MNEFYQGIGMFTLILIVVLFICFILFWSGITIFIVKDKKFRKYIKDKIKQFWS